MEKNHVENNLLKYQLNYLQSMGKNLPMREMHVLRWTLRRAITITTKQNA